MEASGGNSYNSNFGNNLFQNIDKLENALLSLNPQHVEGGGKITWRGESSQFESRGAYKASYYQSVVNWTNRDATCTNLINGLETLVGVSTEILDDISKAAAKCKPEELLELEWRMQGIKKILDNSKKCIDTLEENYRSTGKEGEKVGKIHSAGQQIFMQVTASEALLANRLAGDGVDVDRITPKLKVPDKLMSNHQQSVAEFNAALDSEKVATKIVTNVSNYKETLAYLDVMEQGLVVPSALVIDCMEDAALKKMTNKKTLRDVSNQEQPFNNAAPLKIPMSDQVWEAKAITQTVVEEQLGAVKTTKKSVETKENAAVPTSLRDLDHPEVNHLANFKVQIDERDGHICITCGVIDTQRKADEFVAGLISAIKTRSPQKPPIPLRVVLHQVNSSYGEPKLVGGQHDMSRYIEKQLRAQLSPEDLQKAGIKDFSNSVPIVAHFNTSLNLTSTLLSRLEDAPSYLLNLDGLATQSRWVTEDFFSTKGLDPAKLTELTQKSRNIQEKFAIVSKNKTTIEELKRSLSKKEDPELEAVEAEIEKLNDLEASTEDNATKLQDLEKKRDSLKRNAATRLSLAPEAVKFLQAKEAELLSNQTLLMNDLKEMSKLYHGLLSNIEKPTAEQIMMQNKAKVLGLLLDKQTHSIDRSSNYSRNQEIELSLILDMMLGSTTEINCKSGLDRTGLARSMWDSLRSMKDQFSQEFKEQGITDPKEIEARATQKLIDFVLKQDELTKELDQIQLNLIPKFEGHIAKSLSNVDSIATTIPIRKKIIDAIVAQHPNDPEKIKALLNALKYQDLMAANLLMVAHPVTMESTGVAGLKYGHGKIAPGNPHPLKRLPMFISTEEGKIIQLYEVKYAGLGKESLLWGIGAEEHFFTEAGLQMLERLSQQRGD